MCYVVYRHTCRLSGKSYVGYTSRTMEFRWSRHVIESNSGSERHFCKAIRKYGSSDDVWSHETLEKMSTLDGAKRAEILWIEFLGTHGTGGYNETLGGDGSNGCRHSEETIEKIRITASLHRHSQETLTKMSLSQKKRYESQTERDVISSRNSKIVERYELDGNLIKVYRSIGDAAKDLGIAMSTMSNALRGIKRNQIYHDSIWRIVVVSSTRRKHPLSKEGVTR